MNLETSEAQEALISRVSSFVRGDYQKSASVAIDAVSADERERIYELLGRSYLDKH